MNRTRPHGARHPPPRTARTTTLAAAALAAAALAPVLAGAALAPALAGPASALSARAPALPGQCAGQTVKAVRTTPWAQSLLDPGGVWAFTRGAGQLVAVVDTGVSATAPALAGAVLPGRNMVTGGPANTDCLGEGTFAAGIIAARQVGGAFTGLAPGARILPVDVVAASGLVAPSAVAAGIRFAVDSGASVVDVSLSVQPGPTAALSAAVRYAEARNVVVVAPVATVTNGSLTGSVNTVTYPAAYPGVIAVSAVGQGGSPMSTGRPGVRVDLAAPGDGVVSTGPRGGGDLTGGGSGVATAFVAAAAALLRSYYPQLTALEVSHRLEVTADRPGTAVPDPQVGYGIVDPYAAVTAVLPEESGARAPAPDVASPRLPPRRVPDTWPLTGALIVLGVSAALVTAVGFAAAVAPHGHRRRWRASAWPLTPRPGHAEPASRGESAREDGGRREISERGENAA
jgi:membrane-anchored mycosin MYCP